MSDHTPTIPDLREAWQEAQLHGPSEASAAEFDRAIAKVRSEAKAEALREAADSAPYGWARNTWMRADGGIESGTPADWLRARAEKLATK